MQTPLPSKKSALRRPHGALRAPRRRAAEKVFERLVASGVRKFILQEATIRDFYVALRSAARKKVVPPNPLSALVLTRIVRESMKKRKKSGRT